MSRETQTTLPRPAGLDLSSMTPEELTELKDDLIARSRRAADPSGRGADATMMSDVGFMTDDWVYTDWWQWVERIMFSIAVASTRIGAALLGAGGAIGGALMFGSGHGNYAKITLAVSAAFAVFFALSALGPLARGRSAAQRG